MNNTPIEHIPVLANTLADFVGLPRDGVMVDATVGHGGHSLLLGGILGPDALILGLDIDENCIHRAQKKLSSLSCKVVLVRENFANLADVFSQHNVGKADLIIADLGFCSAQLADPERGLSFQQNLPLDMRLDTRLRINAADIVNDSDEKTLADLIYRYGQERASRRIARFIVDYRKAQPITTTGQLALIVCKALGQLPQGRKSKIHPATRTFQALRIAVNNELDSLAKLLESVPGLLKQGGKVAVISFHSLEDKIVKLSFRENSKNGIYEILTKKPVSASRAEVAENPRARSAKLRIAQRR